MNDTQTYLKLKNKPQNNYPQYIIVHHSGGTDVNPLEDTSHHTAKMMEDWHLSKGWDGVGYHYIIHKNGDIWRGRPETYNGAHATGKNTLSIGICLSGNFDATLPTMEQTYALSGLVEDIKTRYNIPVEKIVPHRAFANKTCYGMRLSSAWAATLPKPTPPTPKEDIKKKIIELLNKL